MAVMVYTGNGEYGNSNPVSITFPFKPEIIFTPSFLGNTDYGKFIYLNQLNETYQLNAWGNSNNYVKKSSDGLTISWYTFSSSASNQYNSLQTTYYILAIGGKNQSMYLNGTEWILTEDQTWTVPYTGNYYIELYGGGGWFEAQSYGDNSGYSADGGSSCQVYDSLYLQQGVVISTIIGKRATSSASATKTVFGAYSVEGAGSATGTYPNFIGGVGTGNHGVQGESRGSLPTNRLFTKVTYSTGTFKDYYGYSANYTYRSRADIPAGNGAVYIKYLDA